MDKDTRLKLAVQKSGRLTDPSLDLLSRCGLKLSRGKDQLMGFGENMPLDVLFVRDNDIPDLVQEDVCELGVVDSSPFFSVYIFSVSPTPLLAKPA